MAGAAPPACCGRWPSPLSRLNLRGAAVAHGVAWTRWKLRSLIPARPGRDGDGAPKPKPPKPVREKPPPDDIAGPPSTLGTLLDRKRGTRPDD